MNNSKEIIYLSYVSGYGVNVKDSSFIINNNFSFTGKLENPTIALIYIKDSKDDKSVELWLEPGTSTLKINELRFKDISVSGSNTQKEYHKLQKEKGKVSKKYKSQLDSLKGLRDMKKITAIRERLAPYFLEMKNTELDFFTKHPNSYITAYMLRFQTSFLPLDSIKLFYERMNPVLKNSIYGAYINEIIHQIQMGSPGSMAGDFESVTHGGVKLMLSNYLGKYVLLDFWASWCVPCRKEHPTLIELYEKYKSQGIEFIGIADDDGRKETWINAIQKDNLPWPQVLRGRKPDETVNPNTSKTDINNLFGIQALPTLILIDKNGLIIGRYQENISDLKNDLKRIFQKE